MKDMDGKTIKEGDTIIFSYGIPPRKVVAPIILKNGKLIAITTGHTPATCELRQLKKYVGGFYKQDSPNQTAGDE